MGRNDLNKLLDELDLLILLAKKGERERRIFAWQMFVWGTYVFLNMGLNLLLPGLSNRIPGSSWFHTLFLAFYLSVVPFKGWKAPLWIFVGYALSVLSFFLIGPSAAVITTILSLSVISVFLYGGGAERKGTSTVAYVGMAWGILFAAFWWIYSLHHGEFSDILFNLWITYVFGIGIFLSGLIFRRFLYLGLLILFVLPPLAKLGDTVLSLGYALSALAMAVLGLTLYLKDDRGT